MSDTLTQFLKAKLKGFTISKHWRTMRLTSNGRKSFLTHFPLLLSILITVDTFRIMNRSSKLFTGLVGLTFLNASGCTVTPKITYNVSVRNHSTSALHDVEVQYADGTWEFTFGNIGAGGEAAFIGVDGMPPIPATIVIVWRDESGVESSVSVDTDESMRQERLVYGGELDIVIENRDSVKIDYKQ